MLNFTSAATAILRNHLPESPEAGYRLLMQKSCSNVKYTLRLENEIRANDELVELEGGIKLFIDSETFPMVDNTKVDFVEENNQSGFVFDNPNITKSGCASCESGC
ncbi:MAG: iron-sulfur cluster assembly accessory protein [Gammaproteobacteria bacterium]|nr:MAG: iron-sulfur cluster assembly accessory protein [Gammaproteobacteria bacterium]